MRKSRDVNAGRRRHRRAGAILALTLIALLVVTLFIGAMTQLLAIDHRRARQLEQRMQARWLSESAIQRARHALGMSRDYAGEIWMVPAEIANSPHPVRLSIRVEPTSQSTTERLIRVESLDPASDSARVLHRSERLIEIPVPTISRSAITIPAFLAQEARHE